MLKMRNFCHRHIILTRPFAPRLAPSLLGSLLSPLAPLPLSTSTYAASHNEVETSTETDDEASFSKEVVLGQGDLLSYLSKELASSSDSTRRIALTAPTGHGKSLLLASLEFPPESSVNTIRVEPNAKTTPWSSARRLLKSFKKFAKGVEEDRDLMPLLNDVFKTATAALSDNTSTSSR